VRGGGGNGTRRVTFQTCACAAQARAFALLDPLIGALVLAVCGIAGIQEYMRARGAMAQFLLALALDDERRARRERAVADAARRVTEEEAARFEQSFGYICAMRARAEVAIVR
jgi:hypothetical protein